MKKYLFKVQFMQSASIEFSDCDVLIHIIVSYKFGLTNLIDK